MRIQYSDRSLHKTCVEKARMVRKVGARTAQILMTRLSELEAADSLDDMRRLPAARCHELTGDRKGQVAVDLDHPRRLVFQPDHDPVPQKTDGGLDWSAVTQILIVQITDYH